MLTVAFCIPGTQAQTSANRGTLAQQAVHIAAVKTHIDNARAAAGEDFQWFQSTLCSNPQMGGDIIGLFFGASRLNAADADFEPVRAFDDLYYVGLQEIGAWALTTPEGIVLIDALFPDNTEERLISNMRAVGLDPADIEYVIVTHAHRDHGGGAKYLQERYGARIVMSQQDWEVAENGGLGPDNAPRRDVVVADGDEVTLGDTSVRVVFTPGHTPGSISVLVPVTDRGTPHIAALWGGPQWGFRNADVAQRELYERSLVKFHQATREERADVVLESHPFLSNLIVKLADVRDRRGDEPNPLIVGEDGVDRYMTIWTECGRANMERYKQYLLKYGPNASEWPHPPLTDAELLEVE